MRQGFDNEKYIELQAARIKERIEQFGGKLYLEFGGKLFDDYHASRVLPGFEPSVKFRMLKSLSEDVEVIIAINANDIEKNKARGDLGITYDEDVLRLADIFSSNGIAVAAVVPLGEGVCELKNLAVAPPWQRRGIGRLLLGYVCDCCAENFRAMEVGTGNSSIGNQHFYRSMGFRRFRTDRGFFLRNYPEPIEEDGIPCTDLVKFRKALARAGAQNSSR